MDYEYSWINTPFCVEDIKLDTHQLWDVLLDFARHFLGIVWDFIRSQFVPHGVQDALL